MQHNPTISLLLVEDDADYASELAEFLGNHGLQITWLDTADDLVKRVSELRPSILVLDQFVAGCDSLTLLGALRGGFGGGVIVLTANQDPFDRIVALETGADDFVAKSLGPRELLARVRAVSRRAANVPLDGTAPQPASASGGVKGPWRLDPRRFEVVTPDGTALRLTRTEFHALTLLLRSPGEMVTRDALSVEVLRRPFSPFDRSVDNMVSRIRRALKPHMGEEDGINAVRGHGYTFFSPGRWNC